MANKRLVLITLDYPPEHGGVARYLGDLVEASQGEMRVIVPEKHLTSGPGDVKTVSMFHKRWPQWWPMVKACRVLNAKSEMIFISQVFPVGTAAWISRLCGGPEYVVLFHGLDLKLANTPWKKFLLNNIVGHARAVFVNSLATKKLFLETASSSKHIPIVLTPGIHQRPLIDKREARKRLDLPFDASIILTVTRFVPRKGIDVTIRAVADLQKKMPLTYAVIGSGTDRGRLEVIAKETGAKVTWASPANDEEKWVWYAACDAFVMPARETADDIEGFGIVYLEAAMAGRPTIAGQSGGAKEAVVDQVTGLIVDENDEQAVQQAILKLIEDTDFAKKLGAAGRQRVEKDFQWQERWEKLRAV